MGKFICGVATTIGFVVIGLVATGFVLSKQEEAEAVRRARDSQDKPAAD